MQGTQTPLPKALRLSMEEEADSVAPTSRHENASDKGKGHRMHHSGQQQASTKLPHCLAAAETPP